MIALLTLLTACSNVENPNWSSGGTRYASGYAASFGSDTADTGGGDPGDDTGADLDGPRLLTGSATYSAPNEADEVYVVVGIAYEDDPDDVDGGKVYFTLFESGGTLVESSMIIAGGAPDPSEALVSDGTISFLVGPVGDASATHSVRAYVTDYTRNRSNTIDIDVTSR